MLCSLPRRHQPFLPRLSSLRPRSRRCLSLPRFPAVVVLGKHAGTPSARPVESSMCFQCSNQSTPARRQPVPAFGVNIILADARGSRLRPGISRKLRSATRHSPPGLFRSDSLSIIRGRANIKHHPSGYPRSSVTTSCAMIVILGGTKNAEIYPSRHDTKPSNQNSRDPNHTLILSLTILGYGPGITILLALGDRSDGRLKLCDPFGRNILHFRNMSDSRGSFISPVKL